MVKFPCPSDVQSYYESIHPSGLQNPQIALDGVPLLPLSTRVSAD